MSKTKPKPTEDTSQRFPTMLPKQFRGMDASIRAVETENGESEDNVLMFTLSSETPYERWFGIEVLDHSEAAIDMSRLKNRAPFLWNHNASEYLGVIEDAYIEEKKIHIKVRFSDRPFAKEKYADCKAGILCKTSVGYQPQDLKWTGEENNLNTYLVTKWMPLEGSLVTIPADDSVGTKDLDWQRFLRCDASELRSVTISDLPDELNKKNKPDGGTMTVVIENPNDAALQERNRISEIAAMGDKFKLDDLARKLIEDGTELSVARKEFIKNLPNSQKPVAAPALNLTEKEKQRFSILKIARASRDANVDVSFERSVSDAIALSTGMAPNGFYVPMNELSVKSQNITNPTQGGNLVPTELSTDMVQFLVNATLVGNMGITTFSGLTGNFDLPEETNEFGWTWVGENEEPDTQTATTALIEFRHKMISSYAEITRSMMQQTDVSVEDWIRRKILLGIAKGIDTAAINGNGIKQPRGILQTAGVNSVALGADGAAITFDKMIDMRTKIAIDNALMGRIGYMTNSKVIGDLQKLKTTTGEYLWKGTTSPMTELPRGVINQIPVFETQQMPSNLTKGSGTNLSSIILADWSMLAMAMWGVLDIASNTQGKTFKSGGVEMVAFQTVDFQLLKKDSFCVINDVVTTSI
jgi:HK97 family phage major capsid protein/HK97 family phage prohead protease